LPQYVGDQSAAFSVASADQLCSGRGWTPHDRPAPNASWKTNEKATYGCCSPRLIC
jgi:hypothetical protein